MRITKGVNKEYSGKSKSLDSISEMSKKSIDQERTASVKEVGSNLTNPTTVRYHSGRNKSDKMMPKVKSVY